MDKVCQKFRTDLYRALHLTGPKIALRAKLCDMESLYLHCQSPWIKANSRYVLRLLLPWKPIPQGEAQWKTYKLALFCLENPWPTRKSARFLKKRKYIR